MATRGQLLDQFRSWIGAHEQPNGSNHVPGITNRFWDAAWCAMTCSVCCDAVGIPLWTAAVAGIRSRARSGSDGWSWHSSPQVADLICFDWHDGDIVTDHVGVVEAIRGDGMLVCIEGNHNNRCERVVRHPVNNVLGYARPPCDDSPGAGGGGGRPTLTRGDTGEAVAELQRLLTRAGYPLVDDGDFGDATGAAVLDFQLRHGLEVDGVVGGATWAALDAAGAPKPQPQPPKEDEVFSTSPSYPCGTLTCARNRKTLDIQGTPEPGAAIGTYMADGRLDQRWRVIGQRPLDEVCIVSRDGDLALDSPEGSTKVHAVKHDGRNANQRWLIRWQFGGLWVIQHAHRDGMVLTADPASDESGKIVLAPIRLVDGIVAPEQQFLFTDAI